jgi:TPR repeat protein
MRARKCSSDGSWRKAKNLRKKKRRQFRYFELAAAQDDGDGTVAVGDCLQKGIGVSTDQHWAIELFRRAAARDLPDGQHWLSQSMKYDISCFKDTA